MLGKYGQLEDATSSGMFYVTQTYPPFIYLYDDEEGMYWDVTMGLLPHNSCPLLLRTAGVWISGNTEWMD